MTQSDRFAARFAVLAQKKEGAFVPFVNLCDPTPEISSQILEALAAGGADALELGIPFSDPCADGPVIEASAQRALAAGSTTAKCLGIIKAFRAKHPDIPVSLMLYVNLVTAPGVENFFAAAKDAGVDAVLIPDVPISMREAEPEWDAAAKAHGIHLIAIAPPNGLRTSIKKSLSALRDMFISSPAQALLVRIKLPGVPVKPKLLHFALPARRHCFWGLAYRALNMSVLRLKQVQTAPLPDLPLLR